MKTRQLLTSVTVGAVMTMSVLATPVAAATNNPFASFSQSLKNRWNKVYLMLPGTKPGEVVLKQMADSSKTMKTAEISFQMEGEAIDITDKSVLKAMMTFAGPVEIKDVYDPKTVKQDLNMKGEVTMQGTTLRADVDMKVDGEVVYMKLNQVPAFGPVSFADLQGEWLKIDPEKMNQGTMKKEKEDKKELTAEEKQKMETAMEELMKSSQVSKARKEKLGDNKVYVLDVTMPDAAVVKYVETVMEIREEENRDKTVDELEKNLEAVSDLKATMWVDQSKFYLRRMELPFDIDVEKMNKVNSSGDETAVRRRAASPTSAMSPFGNPEDLETIKVKLVLNMDKFNQEVKFEAPSDSRDFQEALTESMTKMMGPSYGGAPSYGATPSYTRPRPTELNQLTPSERQMLREYGVDESSL